MAGPAVERVDHSGGGVRYLLAGGMAAGLIGGVLFLLFMVAMRTGPDLWVDFKMPAFPFLGLRVLAPGFDAPAVALGLLSHLTVSVVWGILFAFIAYGLSRPATVALGVLWGFAVWLGMFLAVLPVTAPHLTKGGGSIGVVVAHLIFGVGLAIGFLPYQHPDPGALPRWSPQRARG